MQYIGMQKQLMSTWEINNEYNKSIELPYLAYLDVNNLYGWAMFQKLPLNGFKRKKKKFDEDFKKNLLWR